jgi:hypothetical protein
VKPEAPVTLRFPQICETGYEVRSARGHIFVLTSQGLYLIPHLVSRFLRGYRIDGLSTVRRIETDAFDMAIAHETWLIPMEPEFVSLVPLDKLRLDETDGLAQRPSFDAQSFGARPTSRLETALVRTI